MVKMQMKQKKKCKIHIHLSSTALASMVLADDGAGGGVILMHIFGPWGGSWGPHRDQGQRDNMLPLP